MDVGAIAGLDEPSQSGQADDAFSELAGEDFLKLLIMQITNQDPLEPTSNEDLLRQIASIRDIEVSTTLAESLRYLTQQQRFGAASSLIGRHVTSVPDGEGATAGGLVIGVRFESDGQAVLRLESGEELPIDRVQSVETAAGAAERLIGRLVFGVDRSDPQNPREVQGLVTAVRTGEHDEVYLELDTGEQLRFQDVIGVGELP